jgi:hypothetical protein
MFTLFLLCFIKEEVEEETRKKQKLRRGRSNYFFKDLMAK